MAELMSKLSTFFKEGVWEVDPATASKAKLGFAKTLQYSYAVAREFSEGGLSFRAMGLVYTSLLSLVPLLAVSFSVLKAFGVHNAIEPVLLEMLAPLGPKGEEVTARIIGFLENMKVGVLGFVGFALLFYTVISLLQQIEEAFNYIWRSERTRTFQRRFSDYLSVLLVGPVLVFSGLGLTASMASTTVVRELSSIEPFGTAFYLAGQILPYILICGAFTFLYKFIPTRQVHLKSALVGGIVAGVIWKTAGWAFAEFVANSTKYDAIYSSFAILIVFMIWVYVSWMVLLMGVQVSFFYQYPQYRRLKKRTPQFSIQLKEQIAFLLMYHIGTRFYQGKKPFSLQQLVQMFSLPWESAREILQILKRHDLVIEIDQEESTYVPARDLATISLQEIMQVIRTAQPDPITIDKLTLSDPKLDPLFNRIEGVYANALEALSLKDLVVQEIKPTDQRISLKK